MRWPCHRGPMLVAATITHTNDVAMSFGRFVKLADLFAALQNALATRCTPNWFGGKLMAV